MAAQLRCEFLLLAMLAVACSVDQPTMTEPPPGAADPVDYPGADGDVYVPADMAMTADAGTCPDMGLSASRACGKCGIASITCVDGKEVVGVCMNETGVCAPGDVVYTSAGCQMKTCDNSCKWSAWKLKPGAQCAGEGTCYYGPSCPRIGVLPCVKCMIGACVCR